MLRFRSGLKESYCSTDDVEIMLNNFIENIKKGWENCFDALFRIVLSHTISNAKVRCFSILLIILFIMGKRIPFHTSFIETIHDTNFEKIRFMY